MTEKLECIMLIDDHFPTNYYHKIIIEKTDCCKKIIEKTNVIEALDYLKTAFSEENPKPDMIFLDINMPGLTGWDFLEAYKSLTKEQQVKIIIIMLSTSADPNDLSRADNDPNVTEYRSKPLTVEVLEEIIRNHWKTQEN